MDSNSESYESSKHFQEFVEKYEPLLRIKYPEVIDHGEGGFEYKQSSASSLIQKEESKINSITKECSISPEPIQR